MSVGTVHQQVYTNFALSSSFAIGDRLEGQGAQLLLLTRAGPELSDGLAACAWDVRRAQDRTVRDEPAERAPIQGKASDIPMGLMGCPVGMGCMDYEQVFVNKLALLYADDIFAIRPTWRIAAPEVLSSAFFSKSVLGLAAYEGAARIVVGYVAGRASALRATKQ